MQRVLSLLLSLWIVVLASSSCGGGAIFGEAPNPFYSAGTRLRPEVDDVEGTRLVSGWFDRELGKACSFDHATNDPDPDGVYWCLPRLGTHAADLGPFLDAACTVPLGSPPPDADVPFVLVRPFDACVSGLAFHAVGEAVQTRGYLRNGTRCVLDPDPRLKALVRLGDAVTPPFVRATETVVLRGGRIDPIVRSASDGSSEIVGGFDRTRGEPVRAYWTSDRHLRWLPLREAFGHGTGHSSCTGIASKLKHNAICPISVVATVDPGCGVTLQTVGRALTPTDLEARCQADAFADDTFFFETGALIPDDSFAGATEVDLGGDRIRIRAYADGSRAVLRKSFFDSRTNAECLPALAVDGERRCLPSPTAVPAFTDAACTVLAAEDTTVGCEILGAGTAVRIVNGEQYAVYALEGPHVEVFGKDAGRCLPKGMGYAVRELPPASFARATEIRE